VNNSEIIKLEHVFKMLGNRKRLALLVYLLNGKASINVLSQALAIPYKTAERNLIHLVEAGFLSRYTDNRKVIYSINSNAAIHYAILMSIIRDRCRDIDVKELAKSLIKTAKKIDSKHAYLRGTVTQVIQK